MPFWKKFFLSAAGAAAITSGFGAWETSIEDKRERERMQIEYQIERERMAQEADRDEAKAEQNKLQTCAGVLTDDEHSADLDKERFNRYVDEICAGSQVPDFAGEGSTNE